MEPRWDARGALPKATRLFAQVPLIAIELGLLKRLSKVDRLVLDSMLYHTTRRKGGKHDAGACCVMTSIILRENQGTRLRWPTQVERSMERIVKLGIYKRKGYRRVGDLNVRLFYQATGPEIWEHARAHRLIPRGWAESEALREHNRRERREAERCGESWERQAGGLQSKPQAPRSGIDAETEVFLRSIK